MSGIAKVLLFMVNCVLTNNFIFSRYLGNCPFLGVSNKVETATGMGLAVTFVMGLASLFTYLIYTYILVPLGLSYLSTIVFILVIASLVQIVEMFIKKSSPSLYKALGIYLPLITTNCAQHRQPHHHWRRSAGIQPALFRAQRHIRRAGLPAGHRAYGGR